MLSSSAATQTVEIIDYHPSLQSHFKRLNMWWLEQFVEIEPPDLRQLDTPEDSILSPGGAIFFARVKDTLVGTCALLKLNTTTYELVKMGVDPQYQGLGIGRQLMHHALQYARQHGAQTLTLETLGELTAAVGLYQSVGFIRAPHAHPSDYVRPTVFMTLDLATVMPQHVLASADTRT